jgi:G3E family GTPase
MSKLKFMVVSGFLGAGKTTSMLALTKYINSKGKKACIITNDLGMNQVDTHFSMKSDFSVTEISNECICYQMDNVVDRLNRLKRTENPDLIMSDIPGCGVGALDHVYHVLAKNHANEFSLAPFSVIVDPKRLKMLMTHNVDKMLPDELSYLMEIQLKEADLILLNKVDLLSGAEVEEMLAYLKIVCPDTEIIPISARHETNIDKWASLALNEHAKLKDVPFESLDQEKFLTAENMLVWYNRRFIAESPNGSKKDMNIFISDLVECVREGLVKAGGNVPHLKIFANSGEDYTKVSLIGVECEAEFAKTMKNQTDNVRVIINARAATDTKVLDSLMNEALVAAAEKSALNTSISFTECFSVLDQR